MTHTLSAATILGQWLDSNTFEDLATSPLRMEEHDPERYLEVLERRESFQAFVAGLQLVTEGLHEIAQCDPEGRIVRALVDTPYGLDPFGYQRSFCCSLPKPVATIVLDGSMLIRHLPGANNWPRILQLVAIQASVKPDVTHRCMRIGTALGRKDDFDMTSVCDHPLPTLEELFQTAPEDAFGKYLETLRAAIS